MTTFEFWNILNTQVIKNDINTKKSLDISLNPHFEKIPGYGPICN